MTAQLQIVVKLSKYCNLRCTYCYEFPFLADRKQLSPRQIETIFQRVLDHIDTRDMMPEFIWHGGEPFLLPIETFDDIRNTQARVFGGRSIQNSVQTNGTILTDRHLDLLKSGFFDSVGVSLDLLGDQRVDRKGRVVTDKVITNMLRLKAEGIDFGAIVVLSRHTADHVEAVFDRFDDLQIGVRFLPFYKAGLDEQIGEHALTFPDLVAALAAILRRWLVSRHAIPTAPLGDYVDFALAHARGDRQLVYDRKTEERTLVVDTNGDVYPAEADSRSLPLGNILQSSLQSILDGPERARLLELAAERARTHCARCRFFGACDGYFIQHLSPVMQSELAVHGCMLSTFLEHVGETIDLSAVVAQG